MNIYIASSWKNQHAVEMLTDKLREHGHDVKSFVENQHGEMEGHKATYEDGLEMPFDVWVWTKRAQKSFDYDTKWARECDALIYISPSGTDAWCEVGIAYSNKKMIFGLYAKGEQSGLMRRMVLWFTDHNEMIDILNLPNSTLEAYYPKMIENQIESHDK